jgi:hypothetical protein
MITSPIVGRKHDEAKQRLYDAAIQTMELGTKGFYSGEVNRTKYITQLANLNRCPTPEEWKEIQGIARILAKEAVVNVIEGKDIGNPLTTKKICDMLRPTNSASASDTAQCSPH